MHVSVFNCDWLTEEGMDALDALAPVVEAECEPDDLEAFVNAVFDGEQHGEEEDTESGTDVDEVNEPPVISLNQAREKM